MKMFLICTVKNFNFAIMDMFGLRAVISGALHLKKKEEYLVYYTGATHFQNIQAKVI